MNERRKSEHFDSEIKKVWYDPEDPFEFSSVTYQRQLSLTHVNKILRYLESMREPFIKEPLVVNQRKDKVVLLDGYHRIEALKKLCKKVMIKVELYKDLSVEDEKKIYEEYNIGKQHAPIDLLRPIIKDHPSLRYLIDNSPIPIILYNNNRVGMPITKIIQSYRLAIDEKGKQSIYHYCINTFDDNDAQKINRFLEWYVDRIGIYHHKSNFYNRNFIGAIMKIYFNTLKIQQFGTRLSNFKFDAGTLELMKSSSGWIGFNYLYNFIKDIFNKGLRDKII